MSIISDDRLISLCRELANRISDSKNERETKQLSQAKTALQTILYLRGKNTKY